MTPVDPTPLLRYSLRANAAFSTVSGATCLVAATPLAASLGMPQPALITSLGANLLVFALLLVWLAAQREIRIPLALGIVAADVAWVIGSAAVIAAGPLTTAGNWTVAAVANVVLLFAVLQYAGVRRLRKPVPTPA